MPHHHATPKSSPHQKQPKKRNSQPRLHRSVLGYTTLVRDCQGPCRRHPSCCTGASYGCAGACCCACSGLPSMHRTAPSCGRKRDVIPRALGNETVRRSQAPNPPKKLGLRDEMSPQGFCILAGETSRPSRTVYTGCKEATDTQTAIKIPPCTQNARMLHLP